MKKYIPVFIFAAIILSLCACSVQNNTNNEQDTDTTADISITQNNDEADTEETETNDNADSTTVLIRYFRQRKELSYDDEMKSLLDNIENCADHPDTELDTKIGSITIRHTDDEASEEFANIYLGEDEKIYAQYIDSDNKTAYELDVEAFGLE